MTTRTTCKFYVYILFRPWNMIPCYVGKGHGDRLHDHCKLGDRHKNKHLAAIIKKAAGPLPFEVVFETSDETEAFCKEAELIALYGRADLKKGPLCNLTDGGEGKKGGILLPSGRARVSAAQKGKPKSQDHRAKIAKTLTGRGPSPETIAKRKETASSRSEEEQRIVIKNMSDAQLGHEVSLETRAKIAATLTGRPRPPEVIAKMSERMKVAAAKRRAEKEQLLPQE